MRVVELGEAEAERSLDEVARRLRSSRKTIMVAGAGISCSAGIPDFRSKDGLYNLVKQRFPGAVVRGKDLFDVIAFRDERSTQVFHAFMAELRAATVMAQPTPTHSLLRLLGEQGRLLRCYTQNIDGLEARAGLAHSKIVQLHGDLNALRCGECRSTFAWTPEITAELQGGDAPECENCTLASAQRVASGRRAISIGVLRPDIVLYGEEHPQGETIATQAAKDARAGPQMLVVLGTSLRVPGLKRLIKDMSRTVHAKGGISVLVNTSVVAASEWDAVFDIHIHGDSDAWVRDLRMRQPVLFGIQTRLPIVRKRRPQVVESGPKRTKSKSDDDEETVEPDLRARSPGFGVFSVNVSSPNGCMARPGEIAFKTEVKSEWITTRPDHNIYS